MYGEMPEKPLTIGQVAKMVGRSAATIRRWEADGDMPAPARVAVGRGARVYSENDVIRLRTLAASKHAGRPKTEK